MDLAEDQKLVDRISSGDQESYKTLVARYTGLALLYARFMLQNADRAEEVVFETFKDVWDDLPHAPDREGGFAFLVFAHLRRKTKNEAPAEEVLSDERIEQIFEPMGRNPDGVTVEELIPVLILGRLLAPPMRDAFGIARLLDLERRSVLETIFEGQADAIADRAEKASRVLEDRLGPSRRMSSWRETEAEEVPTELDSDDDEEEGVETEEGTDEEEEGVEASEGSLADFLAPPTEDKEEER